MSERYKVILARGLAESWADWLGDVQISYTPAGHTILVGELADQAALHGLLTRIRDLGIPILLVEQPINPAKKEIL